MGIIFVCMHGGSWQHDVTLSTKIAAEKYYKNDNLELALEVCRLANDPETIVLHLACSIPVVPKLL